MIESHNIPKITKFKELVKFLNKNLKWPIEIENFDNEEVLSYNFDPSELGLEEKHCSKIIEIKQLRPFDDLPWAVFWVNFENKNLPISALRKILNKFVTKKSEKKDMLTWKSQDLLFVTGHGIRENRAITFARFYENEKSKYILREFWWDRHEIDYSYINNKLDYLMWPTEKISSADWKIKIENAFKGSIRENIKNTENLVKLLAINAIKIRKRLEDYFIIEDEKGNLHTLYKQIKKFLNKNLKLEGEDGFYDICAQTITYGLFSARCMDFDGKFETHEIVDKIPKTNPFLKGLFSDFLNFDDTKKNDDIFNELGIYELVEFLDSFNDKCNDKIQEIVKQFGRQSSFGKEDPIIHFYEGFLNQYSKTQRSTRGVYYTPDSVVKYIVESIDVLLRDKFKINDGLASTDTWEDFFLKNKLEPSLFFEKGSWGLIKKFNFINILDPCVGTGTFLKYVIEKIYSTMKEKWKNLDLKEQKDKWNDYVDNNLIERIFGFEVMVAPYTVCHMKLGLILKNTGYRFKKNQRLNIFLNNSLEAPSKSEDLTLFKNVIAEEKTLASKIINRVPITIVLGNPPYKKISSNMNSWIDGILKGRELNKVNYYSVDDVPIAEKKVWLQDDYVKFFALAHLLIEKNKFGIISFVSNSSFMINPTFRGLRKNLINSFNKIYLHNLNGNLKISQSSNKLVDENVFDIKQGVSLNFFVKDNFKKDKELKYFSQYGSREKKYKFLLQNNIFSHNYEKLKLVEPNYFFKKQSLDKIKEYEKGYKINESMKVYTSGIVTSNDNLVIAFSKNHLKKKIDFLLDKSNSENKIIEYFGLSEKTTNKIKPARKILKNISFQNYFKEISFRPLDNRWIFYHDSLVWRKREAVLDNLMEEDNFALVSARSNKTGLTDHFYVTDKLMEMKCGERSANSVVFPKYVYDGGLFKDRKINFKEEIITDFQNKLKIKFTQKTSITNSQDKFCYDDVINFIYCQFYSNKYRELYKNELASDYPRFFIPKNKKLFKDMSLLGSTLVSLHAMKNNNKKSSYFKNNKTKFFGDILKLEKNYPKFSNDKLEINNKSYFSPIRKEEWEFTIGGYQILKKWLKDRNDQIFNEKVLNEYLKVIIIIKETLKIKELIDSKIESAGGWKTNFIDD